MWTLQNQAVSAQHRMWCAVLCLVAEACLCANTYFSRLQARSSAAEAGTELDSLRNGGHATYRQSV